jgi:hypothetical protein
MYGTLLCTNQKISHFDCWWTTYLTPFFHSGEMLPIQSPTRTPLWPKLQQLTWYASYHLSNLGHLASWRHLKVLQMMMPQKASWMSNGMSPSYPHTLCLKECGRRLEQLVLTNCEFVVDADVL